MRTDSKWRRGTDGQIQTILVLKCSQITKGGKGVPGCVHCLQHNNMTTDFFFLAFDRCKIQVLDLLLQVTLSKRKKVSMAGKGISFALIKKKKLIDFFSRGVLNIQVQRRQ